MTSAVVLIGLTGCAGLDEDGADEAWAESAESMDRHLDADDFEQIMPGEDFALEGYLSLDEDSESPSIEVDEDGAAREQERIEGYLEWYAEALSELDESYEGEAGAEECRTVLEDHLERYEEAEALIEESPFSGEYVEATVALHSDDGAARPLMITATTQLTPFISGEDEEEEWAACDGFALGQVGSESDSREAVSVGDAVGYQWTDLEQNDRTIYLTQNLGPVQVTLNFLFLSADDLENSEEHLSDAAEVFDHFEEELAAL